jgi:hypothetical protein
MVSLEVTHLHNRQGKEMTTAEAFKLIIVMLAIGILAGAIGSLIGEAILWSLHSMVTAST